LGCRGRGGDEINRKLNGGERERGHGKGIDWDGGPKNEGRNRVMVRRQRKEHGRRWEEREGGNMGRREAG